MEPFEILYDIHYVSFFVGILFPLVIYWYSTKNHGYWKKKGIPFVKPYPFLGTIVLNRNLEKLELERYKKYGRIYGIYESSKPVLYIGEPDILRKILVKDFQYFTTRREFNSGDPILDNILSLLRGEDWKRVRTIVSPTFSTGKIKRVMSIFEECAGTLIKNFEISYSNGSHIDVTKIYGAFTMDVIASSAFSTKLDSHNDPENAFVRNAKAAFNRGIDLKFILSILMPKVVRLFGFKTFNTENWQFFKTVTLEIIEMRKRTNQTRNDFLQLLMDSANEVSKEEKWEEKSEDIVSNYGDDSINHPIFKTTSSNKHLSIDELISQCVIFFLAGYHTTATSLSLNTFELALNEDIQEKAFEEINDIIEENNGKLTYEAIQKMKYLDNVISETLRMYPPAISLDRTADADYKVEDLGITIPKGMPIKIPVLAMHRDPTLFPEPEKYEPERFNPEEKSKQLPYSYLPFGAGPRNCVGMRFALMELKVCLVHALCTFKFKRCSKTQVPVEFHQGTGLLAPKSINLSLVPRSNNPLKKIEV